MHFLIFGVGLYFLPAIIAAVRHTHNSTGILLLNLFLGWTMVGWFVALLMAIFSDAGLWAVLWSPLRTLSRLLLLSSRMVETWVEPSSPTC